MLHVKTSKVFSVVFQFILSVHIWYWKTVYKDIILAQIMQQMSFIYWYICKTVKKIALITVWPNELKFCMRLFKAIRNLLIVKFWTVISLMYFLF